MPISSSRISQELFDETVLENQDVFDLSPEQALQETLSQYSHLDLSHLQQSHPSANTQQRQEQQDFIKSLTTLKQCVEENESNEETIGECLDTVQQCCQSNPQSYLVLLHQYEGMDSLIALFNKDVVLIKVVETLIVILTPSKPRVEVQSQLRDCMSRIMPQWMSYFTSSQQQDDLQSLLLQLAFVSCRHDEENKKQWMQAATKSEENGIDAVLSVLQHQDKSTQTMIRACQLVTTLCRFDDFRDKPKNGPVVVSSAHANVMEFARHGAAGILYNVATSAITSTTNTNLLAASLSALRVLAIHDDVVQSMVALGVLELVKSTLSQQEDNGNVAAATLGLIRNLSANDEVKTSLCNEEVLNGIFHAMQSLPQNALVQEHGCGTIAAMALRKPSNSAKIVQQHEGHLYILKAMQLFPLNACVQRQGALALRNLVSRSGDESSIRQALLDAGAEEILRKAGQQHATCVDESYAALRDLNCNAKIVKIDAESGKAVDQSQTFGETKPNFRPVLEESSNAAKHG